MGPVVGVAIVGSGPYGLSIAAHLTALGFRPRVFGSPMETWRRFMPKGMVLKSEGFAMDLSEPNGSFGLGAFCAEHGLPYQHIGWPVPVETFAAYGEAFQQRFVPQVERSTVTRIAPEGTGFELELDTSGEAESFIATSVRHLHGRSATLSKPMSSCGWRPCSAVRVRTTAGWCLRWRMRTGGKTASSSTI